MPLSHMFCHLAAGSIYPGNHLLPHASAACVGEYEGSLLHDVLRTVPGFSTQW